jgi:hypothetical protein
MDSLIHFIKHTTGVCGEPHPSLIWGGLLIKSKIKNRRTK